MKKILLLFTALLSFTAFSQITIDEKKVNIDGSKEGFYITIPYGDVKTMENEFKNELKGWKGKISTKGFLFADDCSLKEMGDNTFDVYAKVEENPKGGVFISVAIDLGGAFLSSNEHSDKAKIIESKLNKFAVKASKNLMNDEVKTEGKALKASEKVLSDLEKEQKKLEKEVDDYKKKIKENEQKISDSKAAQDKQKSAIKEQAEKLKSVEKKKASVK